MPLPQIITGAWSDRFPDDHLRVGISRGQPRFTASGYRMYKQLAPGPWFSSVGPDEYYARYRDEILAPLDPKRVAADINAMAGDRIPVLLCFERKGGRDWCHRAMAAEWLSAAIGYPVVEFGEPCTVHNHPLMPKLRAPTLFDAPPDRTPWIGKRAVIDGETHVVTGVDPARPVGLTITISETGQVYPTSIASAQRVGFK